MKKTILLFVIFFIAISFADTLGNGNWYTLDSAHFHCIFYKKDVGMAKNALRIAENALIKISNGLGYDYKNNLKFKIPIVLINYFDLSNGSANMINKAITIYLYDDDIPFFAGNLPWLRRVISHELTHIITFLLMRINYLDLLNPTPASKFNVPDWFLEGTARYFGEEWDYSKQALLVNAFLNGDLLPYDKLSKLNNCSMLKANLIYEQGHSMISYLVKTHSSTSVGAIYRKIGGGLDFNSAFKEVMNESPQNFYWDWREYESKIIYRTIKDRPSIKGRYDNDFTTLMSDESSLKYSPLFYLNYEIETFSYDNDSGILDLVLIDKATKTVTVVDNFVGKYFDFSKGFIYYTKTVYYKNGFYNDLFAYNVKNGVKKRLTFGERVKSPAVVGDKIFLCKFFKGKNHIVVFDLKSSTFTSLKLDTSYDYDYLKFNKNISTLSFIASRNGEHYIGVYNIKEDTFRLLTKGDFYKSNPKWLGDSVMYISTKDGLPQAYIVTLDGKVAKMTNYNTGVFDISHHNNVYYLSIIDKGTFKIVKVNKTNLSPYKNNPQTIAPIPTFRISGDDIKFTNLKPYKFLDNITYFYLNFNYKFDFQNFDSPMSALTLDTFLSDTLKNQSILVKIPIYSYTSDLPWGFYYSNNFLYPNLDLSISHSLGKYVSLNAGAKFHFYTELSRANILDFGVSVNKMDNSNSFFSAQSMQYIDSSFSNYSFNFFDPKNGYLIYAMENYYFSNLFPPALNLSFLYTLYKPINLIKNGSLNFKFFAFHNFGNDIFNYGVSNISDPFLGINILPIFSLQNVYFYFDSTYVNCQLALDSLSIENNLSLNVFGKLEGNFNLTKDWYEKFNFAIGSEIRFAQPQSETYFTVSAAYNFNQKVWNLRLNGSTN